MFRSSKTLFFVMMLCCTHSIFASDLQPYEAVYESKLKGMNVHVKRRLQIQDSTFTLSVDAKKFFFAIHELSVLSYQADGQFSQVEYTQKRRGLSHEHDKTLVFNWTDNTVVDLLKPDRAPLSVENSTYDKLGYQTQMRLDMIRDPGVQQLAYTATNGVRNRVYTFDCLGEELLDTPLGKLRTIKFMRTGDDDNREVFIWVAPDWEYLLVRVDQTKEPGDKTERMVLKSAKIGGKKVVGL